MDFVSSWSPVHSHPSEGSSLSPDLCRWIQPEVRPETRTNKANPQSFKTWTCCEMLPFERRSLMWTISWDPIWIYHGVLSTHQDFYFSASKTDLSRRTAHHGPPLLAFFFMGTPCISQPKRSSLSSFRWNVGTIGLHQDQPYGDILYSV